MKLVISEKQLNELISKLNVNQDINEEGEEGAPEAGTSSDGEQKTGASKWESGVTRGPANQIGNSKWPSANQQPPRGKANPLSEQSKSSLNLNLKPSYPTPGSDYFANVQAQNMRRAKMGMVKLSKYVYKEEDGENFFVNMYKGEFSEALLDLRSFMFSGWGLATQIVVSIVGSEVGAPIALGVIDAAIILNDMWLLSEQGMNIIPPKEITSPWERFKWALTNNPNFLRVVEDIIFIITLGVVRGTQNVIKYFSKSGRGVPAFIQMAKNAFVKIEKGVTNIPGRFGAWLKEKSVSAKKVIEYFESMNTGNTKLSRAVAKLPMAFYVSAVTVLGFELGLSTLSFILRLKDTINPKNIKEELVNEHGQDIQKMVYENEKKELLANTKEIENQFYDVLISLPEYKNLTRDKFKLTNQKKNNQTVFIMNGSKYYIDPSTKQVTKI